jgi:hypothetical protein
VERYLLIVTGPKAWQLATMAILAKICQSFGINYGVLFELEQVKKSERKPTLVIFLGDNDWRAPLEKFSEEFPDTPVLVRCPEGRFYGRNLIPEEILLKFFPGTTEDIHADKKVLAYSAEKSRLRSVAGTHL